MRYILAARIVFSYLCLGDASVAAAVSGFEGRSFPTKRLRLFQFSFPSLPSFLDTFLCFFWEGGSGERALISPVWDVMNVYF
jgi:hypothetical protein